MGIQELLDHPNSGSPAQEEPFIMLTKNPGEYLARVRLQAVNCNPKRGARTN